LILNPNVQEIHLTPLLGFDLETTGLYPWIGSRPELIAIANQMGETYVLEVRKYSVDDLKWLFRAMEGSLLIGHNIKFDCNFVLHEYGVLLKNVFCTLLGAQMIENGHQKERQFDLISVINRFLGGGYAIEKKDKKIIQKSFVTFNLWNGSIIPPVLRRKQIEYAAEDVGLLIKLYEIELELINDKGLHIISRLEHKVLPVLSAMEIRGTKVNEPLWRTLIVEWNKELSHIEDLLNKEVIRLLNGKRSQFDFNKHRAAYTTYDIFGSATTSSLSSENYINYAGSEQILELWREFGENPPQDEEGKFTVGEGAIETYVTENPETRLSEFIRLLLDYRGLSKLCSTYGESLLDVLDKNGCIHTSYTQTRTETGRLSSKEPNLQNIPSKGIGKKLRDCFIPRPGYKMITCDMAGAEVAIAADYSKEPLLLDALKNGVDMHSKLASVSFSIIFKQPVTVSKEGTIEIDDYKYILNELRDDHKSVVFAKFYKAGAKRVYGVLAEYINRHHSARDRMRIAQEISGALDETMPTLSKYLSGLIEAARARGYLVSDKLGRIRYFNQKVYGEAANYPRKLNKVDQNVTTGKSYEWGSKIG